jgi:hypothetical protein
LIKGILMTERTPEEVEAEQQEGTDREALERREDQERLVHEGELEEERRLHNAQRRGYEDEKAPEEESQE